MTDIIIHKHSITAGDAPEPAELDLGELAIQAADGHIYLKKTDGTVNRVTMLPGGTQQQVLYKTGAGDYALGWGTITSTLMGGALWSEVVAEVQRVFALVEGTASVLLSAPATLTAGSTGPITVSVADTAYLTDGTSITGVLGTVYGTLSRSGTTYSFVSNQSYTSDVTFAVGTRFAAAFLNNTFDPLRIGSAEVEDDDSYTDGSGYSHAVVDSAGRIGYGLKDDGSFDINGAVATKKDKTYDAYVQVELDSNSRISRAILSSGQQYFPKADFDEVTIQGRSLSAGVRAQVSGDSTKGIDYDETTGVFSSPDGHANRIIVKWGDSISNDIGNTAVLEQLEPGRQMLTRSTGGIDNGSILARFGAIPVTGRIYWDVKTVTVVSQGTNTIQLATGNAAGIEEGDYIRGANLFVDTVVTDVDSVNDVITIMTDLPAGTLATTADAYKIQRPKIEAGKEIKIDDLWPKTIHDQTTLEILGHVYVKGLKGVPYYSGAATNLPRAFNPDNTGATDWASIIADETDDGFISAAPTVVLDTTVTGAASAGQSTLTLASVAGVAPGHFILVKGLSSGTKIVDVDVAANTVKLSMDSLSTVSGNVRIYERPKVTPSNTASINGIGEVQLKHCINIFDFDPGVLGGDGSTNLNTNESYNPIWWPNQHHTPGFTLSMEKLAQYQAFADTQKHPHGKYLITSYQMWPGSGDYEGSGGWNTKRLYARLAAEAYPENFYDLAREVWVNAESWYQANYLTFYQQGWEKTFIQMGSGAIAGAPTSGTYSGGDALMDGDLWNDDGTLYILLLTTGDATHDAAQGAIFGGSHTLPTTTGQGIWIRVTGTSDSYETLAGTGGLFWGAPIAQGRSGVVGGVTYQGSAYDIARKSSPRIGRRDSAHSTYVHGRQFLGYLIGQELLRRGW